MTDLLRTPAVQELLGMATSENTLVPAGIYTKPKTWGVYEIEPPEHGRSTRRFRDGNHPVRQRELEQAYGRVKRLAVFTSKSLAEKLERLLNGRNAPR